MGLKSNHISKSGTRCDKCLQQLVRRECFSTLYQLIYHFLDVAGCILIFEKQSEDTYMNHASTTA